MREKGKEKEFFLPFSSVISYLCTQIAKRHGPQSRQDMTEEERWHWQEPGTAWRGVGIYHITLTVPSREPLLGTLVIPDNNPTLARVERTALGNAIIDELFVMCRHYPAIRILLFCLMPDHLHVVVHVRQTMETSIRSVVRDYYKPSDNLFEACAAGRLLILSPWPYDGTKRHISRADCMALNAMAEDVCGQLMYESSMTFAPEFMS